MGKEDCPRIATVKKLAVKQGLPASVIECPQRSFCDGVACPPSMVDIFDARMEKTKQKLADLNDARISGQYFSNGDKM